MAVPQIGLWYAMGIKMKKITLVLGILVLIAGNVQTVQAGELNQYEAEIVSKAKGQFEKDGVKYQTDPVLVQELVSYLSTDETDLTADQRDEIIAAMYANVEQGIADGYLIPVKTQENEETTEENHEVKATEENNEVKAEEEGMKGNETNQGSTGGTDTDSENTKQTDGRTDETDGAVIAESDKTAEAVGKDFFKKIRKQPVTETDQYNGKITITDEEGNSLLTVDTVIKNTGFNIKRTAAVLIGMVIVLGICSIAAFRCGFLRLGKAFRLSSRKSGKIIPYIVIPMLFTVLGYLTVYIGGGPVANLAKSHINMLIAKGAPGYSNEFNPGLTEPALLQKDIFDKSEIRIPAQGTHYGNLTCEKVGLEAPLYYGDSEEVLIKGAGQYMASGLPGEGRPILIGGHDGTFFAPLEQIKIDDVISLETNYGKFEYKVTGTKTADAMDKTAYDLSGTEEHLILYTCYPFGELIVERDKRYFVYCDRIKDTKVAAE